MIEGILIKAMKLILAAGVIGLVAVIVTRRFELFYISVALFCVAFLIIILINIFY